MDAEDNTVSTDFPLFKPRASRPDPKPDPAPNLADEAIPELERSTDPDANADAEFADLGLAEWLLRTIAELGLKKPTPVQANCIPSILEGLAEGPYGVFALVMTPTHELAY